VEPLVVGLGNPGVRYRDTRHNVGFQVVDRLARRWEAGERERGERYRTWSARPGGREVTLMQPLTFMNRSGEALAEWAERAGVESLDPAALLVVCDDVYLPVGTLRLRAHGSTGGHRGLESIESTLGTSAYGRLRIGVGGAESSAVLREHVLEAPGAEQEADFEASLRRAADAVECWLMDGMTAAMNRFNIRPVKEVNEE
jgi:PTH1 family peptidyl-tRNA hydrolase